MSLRESISHLSHAGIAKQSQYSVFFGGGKITSNLIPAEANNRLTVSCEECIFPGKSIFTADLRHYGEMMKFPYSREYTNEMTMVFRVGEDFYEKRLFEEWQNMIVNDSTNDHAFYDDYTSIIAINQISDFAERDEKESRGIVDQFLKNAKDDILTNFGVRKNIKDVRIGDEKNIYTCILENAYPTSIQELSLGHANQNTYHRIGVTFTFRKWISVPQIMSGDLSSNALTDASEVDNAYLESVNQANDGFTVENVMRVGGTIYGSVFGAGGGLSF